MTRARVTRPLLLLLLLSLVPRWRPSRAYKRLMLYAQNRSHGRGGHQRKARARSEHGTSEWEAVRQGAVAITEGRVPAMSKGLLPGGKSTPAALGRLLTASSQEKRQRQRLSAGYRRADSRANNLQNHLQQLSVTVTQSWQASTQTSLAQR